MNQKTKEYREKIAEQFIKALEEKQLDWKKEWKGFTSCPKNAATGARYNGINRFWLSLMADSKRSEDNRWATFKQIQDKGWKLKKGSKGVQIEYWQPYHFKEKKKLTWDKYRELKNEKDVGLISKYFTVFNGQDISGIPDLPKTERYIVENKIITKIAKNMNVSLTNDGGDRAFYRKADDSIHLPKSESFETEYAYHSTALHELTHATGAEHRLNRNLTGKFGSSVYAYEELVAEVSSCFMSEHLEKELSQKHIDNHKAYVQGWIQEIKEKPDTLILAIRDASRAASYLEYHAEIITEQEYNNTLSQAIEVNREKLDSEKNIKEDILKQGFLPTKTLLGNMNTLNSITQKENSLKDICSFYKSKGYLEMGMDQKKLVEDIAVECQSQELARFPEP